MIHKMLLLLALILPASAVSTTIASNISNPQPTGVMLSQVNNPVWLAGGFVTDGQPYTLDSISVRLISTSSDLSANGYYRATLYSEGPSGIPGSREAILDLASYTQDPSFPMVDGWGVFTHLATGSPFVLQANTHYFAVFEQLDLVSSDAPFEQIRVTNDLSPANVDDGYWSNFLGTPNGWFFETGNSLLFEVRGTQVPEPATPVLCLLAGLGWSMCAAAEKIDGGKEVSAASSWQKSMRRVRFLECQWRNNSRLIWVAFS